MKKVLILILLFFTIIGYAQSVKKHVIYSTAKTFILDLNNDNKPDTISISSSLKEKSSFNKISISLAGFTKQTFRAKDSWTTVDKWFLDSNKNAVNSKMLFLKKTDKHAAILLFGQLDGAGYRGEFSIINIENNNIKMVFDHSENDIDVEVPSKLIDLENNGRLCFIYTTMTEFDGFSTKQNKEKGMPDIGSYAPYWVYPVNDSCTLNKPLSKKYMEDNYVFAGYSYSEKINILYPRNGGKPKIWKKPIFR